MAKQLRCLAAFAALALLVFSGRSDAAPLKTEVYRPQSHRKGVLLAPMPREIGTRIHAPFQSGKCGVCHVNSDEKNPGPIKQASVNENCYSCHEDTRDVMSRKYKHMRENAIEFCTDCHNSHNSVEKGLLVEELGSLCLKCHKGIKDQLAIGRVQHGAVTKDKKCSNCHNPHASNVERLLIALPYDLCVRCHSKDGMLSDDGKVMTNFKTLLAENQVRHAPIKNKDCSSCHKTHAGDNFRLLTKEYPAAFYAPYERKTYALCYSCHNDRVVSAEETTTLTHFRNGSKNLHFVHVNRERGRTCRACHEVHAAKQNYRIRESVPYGNSGWELKVGYTKLPDGGSCTKTCHETRTYNNKTLTSSAKPTTP
jgi:predicted CXXCH cytochrome family protein